MQTLRTVFRIAAVYNIVWGVAVIFFPNLAEPKDEYFFRRVEIWDEEKQQSIVFLRNPFSAALCVASQAKACLFLGIGQHFSAFPGT